ncbi:MAG TPA: hydrogenase maturation protease [Candidatus Eisenbacteria bacterium]|jgi:hydrogenase maturation protease
MRTLILGLGNDLLSDDAIGIVVTRALRERIPADAPDVSLVESSLSGLALLDLFFGYDRAIVVDGIHTGRRAPGSILELTPDDLDSVVAPSPHYAGLPELLAVARNLGLPFPTEVRILAVETLDPWTIGGPLSVPVLGALDSVVDRVMKLLRAGGGDALRPVEREKENAPHA